MDPKSVWKKFRTAIEIAIILVASVLGGVFLWNHFCPQSVRTGLQVSARATDFYISTFYVGQNATFQFLFSESNFNATFGCNVTGSFVNQTLYVNSTGGASIVEVLPSYDCAVSFQLWIQNITSSFTTGIRTFSVFAYDSDVSGWNPPFEYLGQALTAVDNAVSSGSSLNWTNTDPYLADVLDHNVTSLPAVIDAYAASQNWMSVLEYSAFWLKTWPTRVPPDVQQDINWALGNYTMIGSLGWDGSTYQDTKNVEHPATTVESEWTLYGFYFAYQPWALTYNSSITAKWNIKAAYTFFDNAVNNSMNMGPYGSGLPLWIIANGSGYTFFDRFYDEDANTIEYYLLFAELLNVSDAMNKAVHWWNYVCNTHWNDNPGYFQYRSSSDLWEVSAPWFLLIISQLKYYIPSLSDWNYVIQDIGNRFLSNGWNSPQWVEADTDITTYAIVHAWDKNKALGNWQRRMDGTEATWTMLEGTYLQLNSTYQQDIDTLLSGSYTPTNSTYPAWMYMFSPNYNGAGGAWGNSTDMTGLWNSTSNLFSSTSTTTCPSGTYTQADDNNATALGEILLFSEGMVPGTTSTAYPLEELAYNYEYNIDPLSTQYNVTAHQIIIPVAGPGTITFLYGVSPILCNFTSKGIYKITFTNSWNMIASVTLINATLPTNIIYFGQLYKP